ncbi:MULTISPECIES: 3-oxoacyl-ACP synthase III family protein [Flavobacterium]|uniref:3-oxoacyl-ACP synthase III family protein n=1 Tax=Flavobacterium TaxID=237 RepID=UPI001183C3A8|nr:MULTISPECIES: ketoacyl-ACP synthase III [Flavobacterium]MCR4030912.1 ketoacyl-ACP synthase III [Flavobacterium panacis]
MEAFIKHISYYLPSNKLSNDDIANQFPEWDSDKIIQKIGIKNRNISNKDQFTSDIAVEAINVLFDEYKIDRSEVDYLILCTQSPDYFLPTTACIVQNKAGLSTDCAAVDINQGCSGYIYGLSLAKGLIVSNIAKNVVLVTAEMYSKYIHEKDKGNRSIFGDAASATLISDNGMYRIGEFSLGSDGSGFENLIVKNGGMKNPRTQDLDQPNDNNLFMNGPEIFNFTAKAVPELINKTLDKNHESIESIDYFIFHQANTFMLEYLRKKINIPKDKFLVDMEDYGNTVSSTIPIVLKNQINASLTASKLLLAGFGVGYSWGAVSIYK